MSQKRYAEVTFRKAGELFLFEYEGLELKKDDRVIVDTEHGQSLGIIKHLVEAGLQAPPSFPVYPVLRIANEEDLRRDARHQHKEQEAFDYCRNKIEELTLPMKLIRAEFFFNGSKLLFYFSAEGRVDFRLLVRDLARFFQKRIEMRQIGVRDSSKLIGGVGICGQELCCSRFLRQFHPVSIRMVKDQNLPLNQQKVSGVCGRLMCCLAYEQGLYKDMRRQLPKIGQDVQTPKGTGKVREVQPLQQKVRVIFLEETPPVEEEYHLRDLPEFKELPEVSPSPVVFDQTKKTKRKRRRGLEPVMESRRGQTNDNKEQESFRSQRQADLSSEDSDILADTELDEDELFDDDTEDINGALEDAGQEGFGRDWTDSGIHEKQVSQILPKFGTERGGSSQQTRGREEKQSLRNDGQPGRHRHSEHRKEPQAHREKDSEHRKEKHHHHKEQRHPSHAQEHRPHRDGNHRVQEERERSGSEPILLTSHTEDPHGIDAGASEAGRVRLTSHMASPQRHEQTSRRHKPARHPQHDRTASSAQTGAKTEDVDTDVSSSRSPEGEGEGQELRQSRRRRRNRRRAGERDVVSQETWRSASDTAETSPQDASGHETPGQSTHPTSTGKQHPASENQKMPHSSQSRPMAHEGNPNREASEGAEPSESFGEDADAEKRKRRRRRRKRKKSPNESGSSVDTGHDDEQDS